MGSILIIILTLLSLAGCSSANEIDEEAVKDISDRFTKAIINTVGKEKAQKQESHKIDAGNLNTLNIKSSVGDISINTHASKEAVIDVNITAKSDSKENAEKLIELYSYTVKENIDSINIDTAVRGDELSDKNSIQVKLSISIPENISTIVISSNVGDIHAVNIGGKFNVESNVGDIDIENSSGSYDLSSDVGDISLSDSLASDSSVLSTNTGDIKASFKDISDAGSLTATTDVGDISVTVPGNSDYEAEISEFMKDEKTEKSGSGHTKIKLKTGVGDIDFN